MARGRIVVAGLMVLLAAAVAVTQPPRGGGGGGFPERRLFGPGPAVMLLGAPEVRKELATTQSQNDQIDKLIATFLEESRPDFGDFENSRKKAEEAGKKADAQLAKILEARQLTRLQQLRLQREGLMAFNRPEIVKQLNLSEDQQSKLRKIQEETFGRFGRGPQEFDKALADAVALLTPKQKEKWSELTGKEFKFAQGPQGGFGGPRGGGFGGPMGGPMGQVRELVKQFDKDKDGRLNTEERKAAREFIKKERGGRGGFGRGGFGRGNQTPPKPGPKIKPEEVSVYTKVGLYEPTVLRTFFLEFENKDWEQELADFYHTDVEVPAMLVVDGKKYPNVGVRFRGTSSYFAVGEGFKRSLNISLDYADKKQRLYGYKTLNLLNSHDDPSFLTSVLYSRIARQYLPTPRVNLVKVAINGESWGLYVNQQQFNAEFVQENFKTTKGARWKVQGSPGGGGGLEYLGDRVEDYKRRYKIKSKDDPKAWKALIKLCKSLNETPADKLEEALKPMLDIDGVLKFLALDVVLINNDGYWVRASDYSIYLDPRGVFHILPHDINETFMAAMGGPGGFGGPRGFGGRERPERPPQAGEPQRGEQPPRGGPQGGGFGGPRGGGFELDPLVALNDSRKPLRSKLLAVPSLRTRYLQYVKQIAEESLDWKTLGPVVAQYRKMIEKEVEADTRKLYPLSAFQTATADTVRGGETPPRGRREVSLRAFADQRRKFLLAHPEVKKLTTEKKTAERKDQP